MKVQYQLLKAAVDFEKKERKNAKSHEAKINFFITLMFASSPLISLFLVWVLCLVVSGGEQLSFVQEIIFYVLWFLVAVMLAFPFLALSFLKKWGEKKFKKLFSCSDFSLSRWLNVLADEMEYEKGIMIHWDPYLYQQSVTRILSVLARDFLQIADKKNPNDVQEIQHLKKKFWDAHNLAWALGFAVRPKVWDYVKKEVE